MTTNITSTTGSDAERVASLQVDWIMGWDKAPDKTLPPFDEVFGRFYDFDAPVILFDDFDPQRRVFRTVKAYADAFWPGFSQLRSAEHAIETAPDVIVDGDLAATTMVFLVVLTQMDGTTLANRCTNSQVWRRGADQRWRIVRDHTGVEAIPVEEARRAF